MYRFPHPVTLCGMLEMGTTFLPINKNWMTYMDKSETVFKQSENEVKSILMQKANEALKFLENERFLKLVKIIRVICLMIIIKVQR